MVLLNLREDDDDDDGIEVNERALVSHMGRNFWGTEMEMVEVEGDE